MSWNMTKNKFAPEKCTARLSFLSQNKICDVVINHEKEYAQTSEWILYIVNRYGYIITVKRVQQLIKKYIIVLCGSNIIICVRNHFLEGGVCTCVWVRKRDVDHSSICFGLYLAVYRIIMAQTVPYYITHRIYDVNFGSRLLNTSLWSQCQCCTPIGTLEKIEGVTYSQFP